MKILTWFRSLSSRFFHRSEMENDMEQELRSHIQHRADDLERSGVDGAEALRRARIEFGGYERFKEESREAAGSAFIETTVQDARFSLRVLRKSPGFTVVAVLTLALAIGANAVVFGIMNGLILRPLNVPHPDNLYGSEYGDGAGWQSYPNYVDLRERNYSFESLAAFNFVFVGLDTGKDPSVSAGFAASGNYFDVLKVQPYLGRFFHATDERGPNSAPYLVLSYPYWHSRFQDDRSVLGRVVRLNKHPFTIIGVAPPAFQGTLLFITPDFFVPIVNQEQLVGEFQLSARGNNRGIFEVLGHLRPGVTPAQAVADMDSVAAYIAKTYPHEAGLKSSTLSREGLTSFGRPVRAFVAGLMLLASLILLAAPSGELAAANSLNSLARTTGSSLASALGGTILAAFTVSLGGVALPSLTAYRVLFAICAGAAALGAAVALVIPTPERR